jgi:2-amino-4-hydroxy-6-hydroxymethyldihydropteridine diphosphokinase
MSDPGMSDPGMTDPGMSGPKVSGKGGGGAEVQVVVALGSNLGDRESHLREGVRALSGFLGVERVSRIMETPPWGDRDQGPFLNVVVLARTDRSPREVMDALLQVERSRGRRRTRPGGPRTLDMDLIFHGDAVVREPGLELPHPRWHLRTFVALPLLEILPHGRDPETGAPLAERVAPEAFREPHEDRGPLSGWAVGVGLAEEGR